MRELSIRLRITKSRVETLLEKVPLTDGIQDMEPTETIAIIQNSASKIHQEQKTSNKPKIQLFVTNLVL